MPGRRQRASSTRRTIQTGTAVTLAVFHRSAKGESVERHVAPLRRARRVSLSVTKQTKAAMPPRGTTGILWEIAADTGLDRRRVSSLLDRAPAASYSASADRHLADLSRSLGFRHHLVAPLRWPEVERALGLPGALDLADRLGERLIWFIGFVVALSMLLLLVEFRSVFVPVAHDLVHPPTI